MTDLQLRLYFNRIDTLTKDHTAIFGKMGVQQMMCHCADYFRLILGHKTVPQNDILRSSEILDLVRKAKPVDTPKGFGQVEGDGTLPTTFEEDREILKKLMLEYSKLPTDYTYPEHPYFGRMTKKRWDTFNNFHIRHHLRQFGV
ncbi:MAG: DUF1569 domain-containing protein [Flavobacteriaceae bacterium]